MKLIACDTLDAVGWEAPQGGWSANERTEWMTFITPNQSKY